MKKRVSNIAAAILAGGRNSRMGGFNKAFIQINGAPVIEITLAVLKRTFKEIIIVTNSPRDFKLYEKEAVITRDLIRGAGPLGGMHAALFKTSKEAVFFTACDMPFLHNGFIRSQISRFTKIKRGCLVPRMGSSIEPLHAIYKTKLKESMGSFIKESRDHSIRGFLKSADVYYWDLKESRFNSKIFKNLNTKEDLANVKEYDKDKIKSLA